MMGQCSSAKDTMNNSIFVSLLPSTWYTYSVFAKRNRGNDSYLTNHVRFCGRK